MNKISTMLIMIDPFLFLPIEGTPNEWAVRSVFCSVRDCFDFRPAVRRPVACRAKVSAAALADSFRAFSSRFNCEKLTRDGETDFGSAFCDSI